MNVFTYLLAKRSFLDQLKHEFEEVIDAFLEIFEMIKDITNDVFVSFFFALWLRFDCRYTHIPASYIRNLILMFPAICIGYLIKNREFSS